MSLLAKRAIDEDLKPICSFLVAFTVEDEIGCHGAKILAQRERPDVFVAVDGSPLVPECPIALDGRPGIRSKDRVATYDQGLFSDLCRVSADAGVELQPVVNDGAASDASVVYSIEPLRGRLASGTSRVEPRLRGSAALHV